MPILYACESKITAPSAPANNNIRVYGDNEGNHLKARKSDGGIVDLGGGGGGGGGGGETGCGGGGGSGATGIAADYDYLVYRDTADTVTPYKAVSGSTGAIIAQNTNVETLFNNLITTIPTFDSTASLNIKFKGRLNLKNTINIFDRNNVCISGSSPFTDVLVQDATMPYQTSSQYQAIRTGVSSQTSTTYPLTQSASIGDRIIRVSTSNIGNFARDDYIQITSDEVVQTEGASVTQNEIRQVKFTNNSTGDIILVNPLQSSYDIADNPKVGKKKFIKNIELKNFGVTSNQPHTTDNYTGATNKGMVFMEWVNSGKITNLNVEKGYHALIQFQNSMNIIADHNTLYDAKGDPAYYTFVKYGVATGGSIQNLIVSNNTFKGRCRHFYTNGSGVVRDVIIAHNTCEGAFTAALDTHEATYDVVFIGNTVTGREWTFDETPALNLDGNPSTESGDGISTRSSNCSIIGNILNNVGNGINVKWGRNVIVANNNIKNCKKIENTTGHGGDGIHIQGPLDPTQGGTQVIVSGNLVNNATGSGIKLLGNNYDTKLVNNMFLDCCKDNVNEYVVEIQNSQHNVQILGNTMRSNVSGWTAIGFRFSGKKSKFLIKDNDFTGSANSGIVGTYDTASSIVGDNMT
jgi:Right handed beta helix region